MINQEEVQRDLGLMISGDLTWSCHYKFITAKAYGMLGLLHHRYVPFHTVISESVHCPCTFIVHSNMAIFFIKRHCN